MPLRSHGGIPTVPTRNFRRKFRHGTVPFQVEEIGLKSFVLNALLKSVRHQRAPLRCRNSPNFDRQRVKPLNNRPFRQKRHSECQSAIEHSLPFRQSCSTAPTLRIEMEQLQISQQAATAALSVQYTNDEATRKEASAFLEKLQQSVSGDCASANEYIHYYNKHISEQNACWTTARGVASVRLHAISA